MVSLPTKTVLLASSRFLDADPEGDGLDDEDWSSEAAEVLRDTLNDYFDDTYWHNGVEQKYEGYCTDVFFSEALDFIEESKDKPFFCYIATNAPHSPYNLPKEYYDQYQGKKSWHSSGG